MSMPISAFVLVAAVLCGGSDDQTWPPQWKTRPVPSSAPEGFWQDEPAVEWPGLEGKRIFEFDPWAKARWPRTSESAWLETRLVALYPNLAQLDVLAEELMHNKDNKGFEPAVSPMGGWAGLGLTDLLVHKKGYEPPLWWLEDAARRNKDFPPGDILLVELRLEAKRPKEAREALDHAVRGRPNDPEPCVLLGDIALREERFVEAELLYEKAAELAKKLTGDQPRQDRIQQAILNGLAGVAESREEWPLAQKHLEALLQAVRALPEDSIEAAKAKRAAMAGAMQRRARARFWQMDASAALTLLREAYKIDPDDVLTPEARLSQFYEQLGGVNNHREAAKWMKFAVDRAPHDLRTHLAVARWALETGQVKEAKAEVAKALQIDANSPDALVLRGIVALIEKKFEAAETDFEAALRQEAVLRQSAKEEAAPTFHYFSYSMENVPRQAPDSYASRNDLALALCQQDEPAKKKRALELAEKNCRDYPHDPEAAATCGWVLYRLGKLDEAERVFRPLADQKHLSLDARYYMACLANDRGQIDQAVDLLSRIAVCDEPFCMRPEAETLMKEVAAKYHAAHPRG